MILIAGGTGTLGTRIVSLLRARGLGVRVLTRDPSRAGHLEDDLVEVVAGDVRDPRAVERAMEGAETVISAIQGFSGSGDCSPRTVDRLGNSNLIQAARAGAVEHFILVSVRGAAPDHPMELFRMKYLAERELRESGLAWTIVRPTAYMETWATLMGQPLLEAGRTRIFGRGDNPINFVSVHDVARIVELAVVDPGTRSGLIEIGGPENLSIEEARASSDDATEGGAYASGEPDAGTADPGRRRHGYLRYVLPPVGDRRPLSVCPAYWTGGRGEKGLRRLSHA